MSNRNLIDRWYIKVCRYIFRQKYLRIMAGPLRGYLWPTSRSYSYILGSNEPPQVMEEFCSWFRPDTIFYDIGSNIGYYSFIAATFIDSGKIYAFEPTGFNNTVFRKLLLLNETKMHNKNIEILPFAISDTEKLIDFSNDNDFAEGNTYILNTDIYKGNKIKVQCFSIDELVNMGYDPPGILKIDIEGAEYDALIGAVKTLKKYKPNILMATHNCRVPEIKERCVRYLEDLGYILKHTEDQNKTMEGLDDYLAVHKEKIRNV